MKTLRRYHFQNRHYFITTVTYKRNPILLENITLFWNSWKSIKPDVWVVLPDHFHIIIDVKDLKISDVIHNFKRTFAWNYNFACEGGRVWQNRFWDHILRDGNDFLKHMDYIHFNPVRHKLAKNPFEYSHSSLPLFYAAGYYLNDWGKKGVENFNKDFGE